MKKKVSIVYHSGRGNSGGDTYKQLSDLLSEQIKRCCNEKQIVNITIVDIALDNLENLILIERPSTIVFMAGALADVAERTKKSHEEIHALLHSTSVKNIGSFSDFDESHVLWFDRSQKNMARLIFILTFLP